MPGPLIANKYPRQALLSRKALQAIQKTWTEKMLQVSDRIARLPPQYGNGMVEARMNVWGFIFAIDALRDNAPAIQALLEVVDTFEERPKHQEVFQIVDRLLAFKVEVRTWSGTMSPPHRLAPGRAEGEFQRRR